MKIFYGSEATAKENFIFEHIDISKKTILIVPDQYSLQMERDALAHFRDRGSALLELMVTDFSSLGGKVVRESDSKTPELIDKYGRHMLLSLIIERNAEELSIYKKMKGRNSFTALMNQLISEMKRYGTTPEDLAEIEADGSPISDTYLKFKLDDIGKIFGAYEEQIQDKFLDSEDYIKFYGDLILGSKIVKGADIWVYGFDTFTPLNISVMQRLLEASDSFNVVMTCEYSEDDCPGAPEDARRFTTGEGEGLFDLPKFVISQLRDMAAEAGEEAILTPITDARPSAFAAKIELAETSNIYAEADRAAAYITKLVRDDGYRFGDIALICNDMDVRGRILARTFQRWGIPAFADQKRKVLHQPVIRFVLSLLDIMVKGYENDAIMSMVKTGLLGWSREDEELLQNYAGEFRIRGTKWKEEFTLTGDAYTEEELTRLNEMRAEIVEIVQTSREETGRRNTAEEKVRGIYEYLETRFKIRDKIGEVIEMQSDMQLLEAAAETAQSWNLICNIFTQIVRVLGSERISNETLRNLIGAGLEAAEIGLVPQSGDCVLIGTMQRTRISRTKVLMITGANEGILPYGSSENGLLTDKELEFLEDLKVSISKRKDVSRQEEQLAIYRNLSLPTDILYVSYSMADGDGRAASPSTLFTDLKDMFGITPMSDIGRGDRLEMINSQKATLSFMADAMREYIDEDRIDREWLLTMKWYEEHDKEDIDRIMSGLGFSNELESLGEEMADALYCGDSDKMLVSASRLERYSECPFKHFIGQGLRADEQRVFEIGPREIGDVYHECLMTFSQRLTSGDIAVNDPASLWMTITKEQCGEEIRKIITGEVEGYREGLFDSDAEGSFRARRMIEICTEVAWALVNQIRRSSIKNMRFEEPFGYPGNSLPPIKVQLSEGKEALLRGRIDRVDVMDVHGQDAVSIVDYKSGKNVIESDDVRNGYKLQLMVYMNAAKQDMEPAGVFYFKIHDNIFTTAKNNKVAGADASQKIKNAYSMEGITIGDEELYEAFDADFYELAAAGESSKSETIPVNFVKSSQEYKATGGGELLTEEEFKELCEIAQEQVERICKEIYAGNIQIAPKREKKGSNTNTACDYCGYKSICMFDTSFDGCCYSEV